MKKNCELCKGLARMHCESDQASLCWTCDFKVHSANFLVARHSRTLLCHVCHSPTPWTATGTKLGPTVSVCDNCLRNCRDGEESETEIDFDNRVEQRREIEDYNTDEEEDEDDEVDEEEEEDEDEGNQVVPWLPTTPPPTPPPPASLSSKSEEEGYDSSSSSLSSRRGRRENVNTTPETAEEAVVCGGGGGGRGRVELVDSVSTIGEGRLKRRRLESGRVGFLGSKSIVKSVKRLHKEEMGSAAAVAEVCRLSEDSSAVDCDSFECS